MERISPGRNLQFIPYGILNQSRYLDQQLLAFNNSTDARVGLDAKIVMRDAMTLDLALTVGRRILRRRQLKKPRFSLKHQVEAHAGVGVLRAMEFDWENAERAFRRALAFDTQYVV